MLRNYFKKINQQIIWKKIGFNGCVYDVSVDYDSTDVNDIKDIQNIWWKKVT